MFILMLEKTAIMNFFNQPDPNETPYLNFKNDKSTQTDDYLFKMSAWNDMVSTLGGIFTTFSSLVACIVILFSENTPQTKMTAIAIIGGGGSFGGAMISRYDPKAGLSRNVIASMPSVHGLPQQVQHTNNNNHQVQVTDTF